MAKKKEGHTVADFFCGAGGFSEGFRQMGFRVVFALDMWKPAIETHILNHPDCVHSQMDILGLDTPELIDQVVPDTEVIIGSPPCVAFSGSNKAGKADKTLGLELIEAYLRIVAWKLNKEDSVLRYWILENVPNSAPFIADEYTFKELGLPGGDRVALRFGTREVLNAADHGAPQTRTRFFGGSYPRPKGTHKEEDWVAIGHVMGHLHDPLGKRPRNIEDPLYDIEIPSKMLTDHFYDTRVSEFEWKNARRLKVDHGFMGRMSFPEDATRPSRTVMATRSASTREALLLGARRDTKGGWVDYRLPTIREIASFMSFPITYQFEGKGEGTKYRLVGNAVCPKMSSALARAILLDMGETPPDGFIPLENRLTGYDLTGTKRAEKAPRNRKPDARFAIHIPGLKTRNMRVELTNTRSDFDNGHIIWECILHWGTGKNARWYSVDQGRLEKLLATRFGEFPDLEKDVQDTFRDRLPGPGVFQGLFCRSEESDMMSPMEALEVMRDIVDRHFPPDTYGDRIAGKVGGAIGVDKDDIPLRILMGLYICNHVVGVVNSR